MSTQGINRRRLITSIRPNGKIRPVPRDAVNVISHDEIQPGNLLTNIHDEYIQGRYYKKESLDSWLKTNPTNPATRQRVTTKTNYIASINGNTGGVNLPPPTDAIFVRVTGPLSEFLLQIKRVVRAQTTIQDNPIYPEFLFPLNISLKSILLAVFEKKQSNDLPLVDLFIYLYGFRDGYETFLLNPSYQITMNGGQVNINQPITNYALTDEEIKIVCKITKRVDSLNLKWPANMLRTHREQLLMAHFWPGIKTTVYYDVFQMIKQFLLTNSTELEYYKAQIGTDKALQLGKTIRQEINQVVYEKVSDIVENESVPPNSNSNRSYGGSRKRRQQRRGLRKKTRKNENKIKSQ